MFDLSTKRELNQGFGNSLSVAVELVVSPLLMALLGWAIDGWVGTRPVFTVALFVFTLGYIVWKQHAIYQQSMDRHERELLGPKPDRSTS